MPRTFKPWVHNGMSNSEKKSAQIIAIDSRKARAVEGAHETPKAIRYAYRIAGCGFLLGEGVLSEVVIAPTLAPVPRSPEWLLGLTNVRGTVVPVFDLWRFVRTQLPERTTNTVLVLDMGTAAVGLLIDELPKLVPLDSQPAHTLPSAPALQPFLGRGLQALGREWWEFDHKKFLARLSAVDSR